MVGHTPGPWTIGHENSESGNQWYEVGPATFVATRSLNCSKEEDENALADANLIAAAPDLYEALKELRNLEWVGSMPDGFLNACRKASMALGKAEGKYLPFLSFIAYESGNLENHSAEMSREDALGLVMAGGEGFTDVMAADQFSVEYQP